MLPASGYSISHAPPSVVVAARPPEALHVPREALDRRRRDVHTLGTDVAAGHDITEANGNRRVLEVQEGVPVVLLAARPARHKEEVVASAEAGGVHSGQDLVLRAAPGQVLDLHRADVRPLTFGIGAEIRGAAARACARSAGHAVHPDLVGTRRRDGRREAGAAAVRVAAGRLGDDGGGREAASRIGRDATVASDLRLGQGVPPDLLQRTRLVLVLQAEQALELESKSLHGDGVGHR
mmetsp:Transcript_10089/g.29831  ORF Transcript_10089/g.29831 Transcript_10089/m.29831 type:complete len:237 (-) Transcript_10089:97-807(-)